MLDANVLVDFQAADLSLLTLASRHIGKVHIISSVLQEVEGLDETDCLRLGLHVVEPTLDQALEAAMSGRQLSFEDRLCLVVCRDNGWTCVSNDKALRKSCKDSGISVLWGLQLILELVHGGHLPAHEAVEAAERIHRTNPYISTPILESFRKKIAILVKRTG